MSVAASKIRSEQRAFVTVVALIFGPLFMVGPLVAGVWMAVAAQFSPPSLGMLLVTAGLSVFFAYHMLQNYQWVELDGDVIRGRRFWTRQYVERSIHEIEEVVPLVAVARTVETAVVNRLLGSNRGYEIRFQGGGRRNALVRGDMTNVQELADAVLARLRETA